MLFIALTVDPEEVTSGSARTGCRRVARLQREAKVLVSLVHSDIAVIHRLQGSGGMQLLVLKLVEGEAPAGISPNVLENFGDFCFS
jgi:hypothetical protein